ncbi:3-oxoacyl-[acyl-carrier protein] reductase [Endobacter medicaginis]|uniref:3-oxoacyl-ACP reductase n=1 Tax=Endobacter medicaginis TaxID=1181271 RepID=A0A839V0D1_9PROT|nr:3-oxoacyl-ACP reductase [Endobacter medicaginis]MBB3173860.1 3-oxoacyl-[acyl-carrier protein] reductase [Endobacter medicaginis]MCX5476142.1 3-oxoacyl-ACP reductase [Endobacter medicaginis]NVN29163.1 3-oxoacyl-ACP reductase [Endobacter medicaginis]
MASQDQYLSFSSSGFGKWLTGTLGLPQPIPLVRYRPGKPELRGPVVVGAAPGSKIEDFLASALRAMGAVTLYHPDSADWRLAAGRHEVMTGRFVPEDSGRTGALLFDATAIADTEGLKALYAFFHDTIRSLATNGRIVVIGTAPEDADSIEAAAIQRGLEGFTRSLGKEVRRAVAVQLVWLKPGGEASLDSTLRFFLSGRSAYVSGQTVRVGVPVTGVVDRPDPARSQAGRTVLITGASRGIGLSIAETFARDGAQVVLLDIPPAASELAKHAERLGGAALALDITSPDAQDAIAADAAGRGGYDVVVHNAGITRDKTIAKMSASQWDSVLDVNFAAPLHITEKLLVAKAIRPNGRVVFVSSLSGIAGNLGQSNYALSKAALIGAVGKLAPLAATEGVTVNAVAPGFIETQMTAAIPFAIREAGRRMNSMSQGGLPVDVAETIAWFAHPGSGGINGAVVRVCGQSLLGA